MHPTGQRTRNEGSPIIENPGRGVNPADEGSLTSTNQAHAKFAVERRVRRHGELLHREEDLSSGIVRVGTLQARE